MDDFSSDQTTTGTVTTGTLSHGDIETVGDTDWFAVELEAGTFYRFQIYGRGEASQDIFGKTLLYKKIELFDPSGIAIDQDSQGDRLGQTGFSYMATETGTFHISASGRIDAIGSYALKLDTIAPDIGDTKAESMALAIGSPINLVDDSHTRRIDHDWFSADLEAGRTYVLELDRGVYWPDYVVSLRGHVEDASGSVIATTIGDLRSYAETAVFTPESSGTHFFDIVGNTQISSSLYSITLREAVDVTGTAGNDWLTVPGDGHHQPIAISGGAGQDMISFASRALPDILGEGVVVNLDNGLLYTRTPVHMKFVMDSIEHATGSNFADTLYGRDGAERLRGLGGNDTFFSSEGADTLEGGAAWDTLDFRFSDTGVSASLLKGRGWSGDAAGDRYAGIEQVNGSFHDDILWGDHGNNRLDGSHGDDTLIGNGGDDILIGGFGQDVIIYGGNRADYSVTQTGFRTDVTHLNGGAEGHDVILHAEILRFADGDLLL
ncbi:MAG: hypothetical protein MRY77_08965 [Rhodobacteraceae bacterium]|nr:hypothetical protein [Paracoccaceae bacterium]